MFALEESIEPFDLTLHDGSCVRLVAGYPEGRPEPREDDPVGLFAPVPVPAFGPVAIPTPHGPMAALFQTRRRAVAEGPRRAGLGDGITLCSGPFLDARLVEGADPVDAPGWTVKPGQVLAILAHFNFPLRNRTPIEAGAEIELARVGGGACLVTAEQRQRLRDTAHEALTAFLARNPGLPDLLERGLALMDSRIYGFQRGKHEVQSAIYGEGEDMLAELANFEFDPPGHAPGHT